MKKLPAIILFFLITSIACAQNRIIKGSVTDTLNKQTLSNSVIAVLRVKDSVLIAFTRSDKSGNFELTKLPQGKHIIMVTYPAYADFYEDVDVTDDKPLEIGTVKMTLKSKLLEDVFVRTRIAAIRMKGDTIEYKADSFKVSAGASVEEMLRKLPGLQVDKDGNITAQGTKIEKVLVDGEEFFGDDPTMATKNLQADAIDKVQVFDKKSDQAAFTGIDDGQKTKTLNLTLKEEKKKGYFGKLELKGGLDDKWSNTAMVNAFKGKRKLSAYGIMSSTGATGLSWEDKDKYGEGNNMEYNADEGYFYSFGSSDEFDNGGGSFGGEGLPKSYSAGLNYGNKFNKDKQNLNGSYRYNQLSNEGGGNTTTQTTTNDRVLFTNENRNFHNTKLRHSANGTLDVQIDSFTSIKGTARGYTGEQTTLSRSFLETQNLNAGRLNSSNRNSRSSGTNNSFNSTLIFRKRFKKAGRTISLSLDEQYKSSNTEGFLYSLDSFYRATGDSSKVTDQKKVYYNNVAAYNGRFSYTEPILKNTFMEVSYGLRSTQSESKKLSYDKTTYGKYETLVPTFSNHYNFNVLTNTAGVMFRYNSKKYNISAGSDVAFADFKQTDLMTDSVKKYNYTNLFPRGTFQYKFNPNSRLSLNYNGSTRQPTIEQIQPVRDNTNTLNIAEGNPNLKQEFRNNLSLSYNFYKVLTQRGLYTSVSFNNVSNAISTDETIDNVGKRTYHFINVNGNYNGSIYSGYNFKMKKLDLSMNFGFNASTNRTNSISNNRVNVSDNNNYGFNFSIYKYKEKKYNVNYYSSVNYNTSKSTINLNGNTNFYSHSHNIDLTVTLPAKFELQTRVNANFREKIYANDVNNNVVLINGYLGRKLLKNDKAMIRIEGFDLLDQNKGYSRYSTSNVIRENTYETLRRYFLLSFVWNFSKTPAGMEPGR